MRALQQLPPSIESLFCVQLSGRLPGNSSNISVLEAHKAHPALYFSMVRAAANDSPSLSPSRHESRKDLQKTRNPGQTLFGIPVLGWGRAVPEIAKIELFCAMSPKILSYSVPSSLFYLKIVSLPVDKTCGDKGNETGAKVTSELN